MPQMFLSKWPTRTPAKQLRQCLPTVRRVDHTGPTVPQRGRGLMGASLPEPGADVGRSRSGHVDRDVGPQVISSVAPCASVGSATVAGVASAMIASSGLNVRAPAPLSDAVGAVVVVSQMLKVALSRATTSIQCNRATSVSSMSR